MPETAIFSATSRGAVAKFGGLRALLIIIVAACVGSGIFFGIGYAAMDAALFVVILLGMSAWAFGTRLAVTQSALTVRHFGIPKRIKRSSVAKVALRDVVADGRPGHPEDALAILLDDQQRVLATLRASTWGRSQLHGAVEALQVAVEHGEGGVTIDQLRTEFHDAVPWRDVHVRAASLLWLFAFFFLLVVTLVAVTL